MKTFFTGMPSLLTKETANSAMKSVAYSSKKIKETLQYDFIPIDKTIKEYCRFFEKELI